MTDATLNRRALFGAAALAGSLIGARAVAQTAPAQATVAVVPQTPTLVPSPPEPAGILSQEVVELWPVGRVPGSAGVTVKREVLERSSSAAHDRAVTKVSRPMMEVFRPEKPNGAAIIVAPGGGFVRLAIDKEGAGAAQDVPFEEVAQPRPVRFDGRGPVPLQQADEGLQGAFGLGRHRQALGPGPAAALGPQQLGGDDLRRRAPDDLQLGVQVGKRGARRRREEVGDVPPRRDGRHQRRHVEPAQPGPDAVHPRQVQGVTGRVGEHPQAARQLQQRREREPDVGGVVRREHELDHGTTSVI